MLIQMVGWNGLRNAVTVGGTFFGATYKIEIPRWMDIFLFFCFNVFKNPPSFINGIEKSMASFLGVLIVRSAIARSAF